MLPLINYTICFKQYGEAHIGIIYPSEDERKPLRLWIPYQFYNPKKDGNIEHFIKNAKTDAYLNDYKDVEEIISSYCDDYIITFLSNEKEIDEKFDSFENGYLYIAPQDTLDFIVSSLNN